MACLVAAVGLGLAGCDDGTGATTEELLGLWGAVELSYTSDADPSVSVDLIAELGVGYSIHLITDGTYNWQLSAPGQTESGAGTFEVRGNQLTLTPDSGSPTVYRFTFDQIFLTLVDTAAVYDFDDDGTPEPATERIVLDRF